MRACRWRERPGWEQGCGRRRKWLDGKAVEGRGWDFRVTQAALGTGMPKASTDEGQCWEVSIQH